MFWLNNNFCPKSLCLLVKCPFLAGSKSLVSTTSATLKAKLAQMAQENLALKEVSSFARPRRGGAGMGNGSFCKIPQDYMYIYIYNT